MDFIKIDLFSAGFDESIDQINQAVFGEPQIVQADIKNPVQLITVGQFDVLEQKGSLPHNRVIVHSDNQFSLFLFTLITKKAKY